VGSGPPWGPAQGVGGGGGSDHTASYGAGASFVAGSIASRRYAETIEAKQSKEAVARANQAGGQSKGAAARANQAGGQSKEAAARANQAGGQTTT
jgi:hypothetical protein